jgi:hypothetical protein
VACDIRDHYRQLLEDSVEDNAATQLTLEKFERYLEEPDGVAMIAFAVTQSKLGRLEPDVRDRALAIIDAGADLAVWEQENPKLRSKRRAVLEKARAQLSGSQPPEDTCVRRGETSVASPLETFSPNATVVKRSSKANHSRP